jgi:hypothetical protein
VSGFDKAIGRNISNGEHILRVVNSRMLRKIFGPSRQKVIGN